MGVRQKESSWVTAPAGEPFAFVDIRRRNGEVIRVTIDAADVPLIEPYQWHIDTEGYARRTIEGGKQTERMARRILGLKTGEKLNPDHISRDKLDNRRCNLRVVTHAENCQNRHRTDGVSKHRGVTFAKRRKTRPWQAYGCVHGEQTHLGFYDTEQEAADAAREWRRVHLPYATD